MSQVSIPNIYFGRAAQAVFASLPIQVRNGLNGRLERGLALAIQGAVKPYTDLSQPHQPDLFQVRSSNQFYPPFFYIVDLEESTCECPDFRENGFDFCKHLLASLIVVRVKSELIHFQAD